MISDIILETTNFQRIISACLCLAKLYGAIICILNYRTNVKLTVTNKFPGIGKAIQVDSFEVGLLGLMNGLLFFFGNLIRDDRLGHCTRNDTWSGDSFTRNDFANCSEHGMARLPCELSARIFSI